MVVREDNTWLTIGDARSQKIQYRWNPNSTSEIVFILSIDNHTLSQIEKLRRGQRLSLRPTMRFIFHPDNEPNNTQEKEIGIEYWHIPKSHWVEEILPKVNYRSVALIEVAEIDYPEKEGLGSSCRIS